MRISIHQSHYLPWLRYFDKIARSDVFVLLDDIQFNKNGWQNRNRVKGAGGPQIITVPVLQQHQQNLRDVRCNPSVQWQRKHWRTLEQLYGKAPHFQRYAADLQRFYTEPWDTLTSLNEAMLKWYLQTLGIGTRIIPSHELGIEEISTARLVTICKRLGANEYLTGAHAMGAYLDQPAFAAADIGLVAQSWTSPVYPQQYPTVPYVPDMALVDLLFNVGPDSLQVLMSGGGIATGVAAGH